MQPQMIIFEEEHRRLTEICERLIRDSLARAIFFVDKDGQLLTYAGDTENIDKTSLASLVAGTIAATGGLAKLFGEREFPVHFHEGEREHIHISLVGDHFILVVIFDDRSSLGLVRLRVKRSGDEFLVVLDDLMRRAQNPKGHGLFEDITDEDIDSLFDDAF